MDFLLNTGCGSRNEHSELDRYVRGGQPELLNWLTAEGTGTAKGKLLII